MVTHLSIILGLDCLTSVIWQFTLTAFTFGSCLYCANVSHKRMGEQWTFYKGLIGSPTWMSQLEHNTSMSQQWGQWGWMVRLLKLSNANSKMDGHLGSMHFFFFHSVHDNLPKFTVQLEFQKNSFIVFQLNSTLLFIAHCRCSQCEFKIGPWVLGSLAKHTH